MPVLLIHCLEIFQIVAVAQIWKFINNNFEHLSEIVQRQLFGLLLFLLLKAIYVGSWEWTAKNICSQLNERERMESWNPLDEKLRSLIPNIFKVLFTVPINNLSRF